MTGEAGGPGHWHMVVPGSLAQRTGGTIYDRRIVDGCRAAGQQVSVHELPGRFPEADPTAAGAMEQTLAGLPDGSVVVVDGLALGGLPDPAVRHGPRLRLLALVHHPLADETGLDAGRRSALRRSEAIALAACRGVIVTSTFTARRLAAFDVAPARIRTVIPGTSPALGLPRAPRRPYPALLCVAAVTPRKGHDTLAHALARLREIPLRCTCVGSLSREPDFVARLRKLITRLELEDRLLLAGELEGAALARHYAEAALFVLPSRYEGYGMVFCEAMAHGLPVVAASAGAVPDTVPAQAGLLVPPDDPVALAAAVRRCLEEPGLRERLAAGARAHARRLPDWPQAARGFASAMEELLRP